MSRSLTPRLAAPLLLAIFLDLAGFSMIIPDMQTRLEGFGARGWLIGTVLAVYFLVQSLVSPLWGRLSDRIGRKPVLVVCGLLSALSLLVYAFAQTVAVIFVSRIVAGFAAANVVVAQAYLADVTARDDGARTAAMGKIGAATTGGLILGPALGGWLADAGGNAAVGGAAAGAALLGAVWIALAVPHLTPSEEREPGKKQWLFAFSLLRETPALRPLFLLSCVSSLALACLEGTFGRLIRHTLGFGPREFGWIFGYEALLSVIVQSLFLGRITARVPARILLCAAFLMEAVGLAGTPLAPSLAGLFLASTLYALGAGLANPTLNGLASAATPERRQGEMFGSLQAVRALGFLFGPIGGGLLFDWRPASPYYLAGFVVAAAGLLTLIIRFTTTRKLL